MISEHGKMLVDYKIWTGRFCEGNYNNRRQGKLQKVLGGPAGWRLGSSLQAQQFSNIDNSLPEVRLIKNSA